MNKFVQKIFINEIKKQCDFFNIGLKNIHISMENINSENEYEKNFNELWYSLQNILVTSANISKILWSVNNKYKNRGFDLRKLLNIDDNSIFKSRLIRNSFEHFDEKIEEWQESVTNHIYVDTNIGDINAIKIYGMSTNKYMRNFDYQRMELTFKDIKYDINKVSVAITELYNNINNLEKEDIYIE